MGLQPGFGVSQHMGSVPSGPPFAPGSADNGLSVDSITGHIVLGNDVGQVTSTAKLLSDREIMSGGFIISLIDAQPADLSTTLLPASITFRGNSAGIFSGVSDANFFAFNFGTGTSSNLSSGSLTMQDANSTTITLTPTSFLMADGLTAANGVISFFTYSLVQSFQIQSGFSPSATINLFSSGNIGLGNFDDNGSAIQISGASTVVSLDGVNGVTAVFSTSAFNVQLGDVNGVAAATVVLIDDSIREISLEAIAGVHVRASTAGLIITGDTTLIHTRTALSNAAGAALGTLLNAPVAGNPTKWITVDDNGTPRRIPTW